MKSSSATSYFCRPQEHGLRQDSLLKDDDCISVDPAIRIAVSVQRVKQTVGPRCVSIDRRRVSGGLG